MELISCVYYITTGRFGGFVHGNHGVTDLLRSLEFPTQGTPLELLIKMYEYGYEKKPKQKKKSRLMYHII